MANYAIVKNGVVTNIIVADDQETANLFGHAVEYSDASSTGIGYTYDGVSFTPPSPYPSWVLVDGVWTAPIPYPTGRKIYSWNETTNSWDEVTA